MDRRIPLFLPLSLLLTGLHCGGSSSTDMAQHDMAQKADLGPPMLTGLPSCTQATVTGAALFTSVVKPQCATTTGCHGTDAGFFDYSLASSADMVNKWVGVKATEVTMNRVTANMPNQSYVMFRLLGEGAEVDPPNGEAPLMPLGGSELPAADLCMFLNWINGGATM